MSENEYEEAREDAQGELPNYDLMGATDEQIAHSRAVGLAAQEERAVGPTVRSRRLVLVRHEAGYELQFRDRNLAGWCQEFEDWTNWHQPSNSAVPVRIHIEPIGTVRPRVPEPGRDRGRVNELVRAQEEVRARLGAEQPPEEPWRARMRQMAHEEIERLQHQMEEVRMVLHQVERF